MFDTLRFAKKLDEQLAGRAVGYQYAIYEGEKLSISGAGGFAVLLPFTPLDIPMTTDHQMHAASMSKTITATAFMRAMEILNAAGANISIDSKIAPYLPLAWGNHGPHVDEMTFKHLLTHRSGLQPAVGGHDENLFENLKQTIANGANEATWNRVDYQNCNYSLLRILIPNMLYGVRVSADYLPEVESPEHRTARYYFDFVRDQVLGPVGLGHVSLGASDPGKLVKYYSLNDTSKSFEEFTFTAL